MNRLEFETLEENLHFEGVMDIYPGEVNELAQQLKLIDVREDEEFTGPLGHVEGSELIPLDELPEKLPDMNPDQVIVFVCRSGQRSARAAALALSLGFDQALNMAGGMILWNQLGLPKKK